MKEYILKREAFVRLFSLMLVVISVFLEDLTMKLGLLLAGVAGLILVYYFKGQKTLVLIFSLLLIIAIVGYIYMNHLR